MTSSSRSTPSPCPPPSRYEDIRYGLDLAISEGGAVSFVYDRGSSNPPQVRTLTPSEIIPARDGEFAVLGHDHDRDEPRQFRLDRIEALVPSDVEPYRG